MLAALACAGATLLLLRLGSGHTHASRSFAALPQFDVWVWIYAAEVGAAAALGITSFPAFRLLARTTGRRATILAAAAWPAVGALVLIFGPHAVGEFPLWLAGVRAIGINVIASGISAAQVPRLRLLTFGGVLTALTALVFVPAYVVWQERVSELRDTLHPVPEDGRPAHDWFQARDDFDALLATRVSAGRVLTTAFGVLAPLTASVVSALLSAGQ